MGVKENELYLIHFRGYLDDFEEINLNYIFPHQEEVFASWFSGTIKVPQGRVIQFSTTLNNSIYEEYLHLTFENGILVQYRNEFPDIELMDINEFIR